MKFLADLHIHSRFSRATARNLTLPNLDLWAARKGLSVIGTGDMTHPEWLGEIKSQLMEAEDGLYRLRPELVLPGGGTTRFVITGEISNIYKKDGRVRKVHNLILMPDLVAADQLAERLDRIGNIKSDGRPILGLDARDLLEICLDVSAHSFFIPAHIWTPWFSILGSKSGFDRIEDCYGDLTGHIHALETGLSSDPPMNWRLSALDRFVLVSNSDAHSPDKLGREANLFDTDLSYPAMVRAMQGRGGFDGTIEFFPEEGKYHLDGHRNCGSRLDPDQTRASDGRCPVCGHPVTVGVMNRVQELADRPVDARPPVARPFFSLIPLAEVLGETLGVGAKSKRVLELYDRVLNELGPELHVLRDAPLADIARVGGDVLSVGIERMRQGKIQAEAGYDGEYGRISLFEPGERTRLVGQNPLFAMASPARPASRTDSAARRQPLLRKASPDNHPEPSPLLTPDDPLLDGLNPEQREAVIRPAGPLCIVAGPGTGKTMVLTRRAAWLIREELARPEEILGVTFTRKAAEEMAARLIGQLPFRPGTKHVSMMTFHALGLRILQETSGEEVRVLSEDERLQVASKAAEHSPFRSQELSGLISLAKQHLQGPGDMNDSDLAAAFGRYEVALAAMKAVDVDDLVGRAVDVLNRRPDRLTEYRNRFKWLLVDEFQDVNLAQYQLIRLLAGETDPHLTVIGDPDQAIYGFRGADAAFFRRFQETYPQAGLIRLTRNYRSTETILNASAQVIANNPDSLRAALVPAREGAAKVTTAVLDTASAEAEFVVSRIEKLLGGTSHYALDSGRADSHRDSDLTLGDIAVLYRLHAQAPPLIDALSEAGLPFQVAGKEPLQETDQLNFRAEKISLLTMHAAKGLEFEIVFMVGLEEALLPYHPPQKPPVDAEEERRLFYVAMTRAKRQLFLTRSRKRSLFGRTYQPAPSIFLDEIEKRLKVNDRLPAKKSKAKSSQMPLF